MNYDPGITQAILSGIAGIISVNSATTFLVGLFKSATDKMKKVLGYVFAAGTSTAFTIGYALILKGITMEQVPMYAFAVWFTATKLYDTYHTPKTV